MEQNTTGQDGEMREPEPSTPNTTGIWPPQENAVALTVVGLGASAGGIEALQAFFTNTPVGSGLAFVVVLHLSPEHESHLAEVLARTTTLPVQQVQASVPIQPNHIYVIPPDRDLIAVDGMLCAVGKETPRGRRVSIDRFFRTLAEAHGPEAVAVILSGTGEDGVLGLKLIKETGGLVVAQEPEEAAHDAMPRSAIATGLVDFVLPAGEIAAQIIAYRDATLRMRLPKEAAPSQEQQDDRPETETALAGILSHLQGQTGHDFAPYKRATVLRRIGRRLQINELPDLPAYLGFLKRHPGEASDLLGDLLISVTQFFRDPDAWEALARDVIPRLFENKGTSDEVRAWVCGCATGEEAYTLAILLLEQAAKMEHPPRVQVFATDMAAGAIALAREAGYPETIAADVSPERLRGWFYRDNGRYQIRKEVRESVLFALHDVLRDTPFSRLDLITCRNLLIYLNAPAQTRIFEIFHFALRTDGRLMLGSSESVDGASALFGVSDKPNRFYVRRSVARSVPIMPPIAPRALSASGRSIAGSASPVQPLPTTQTPTPVNPPLLSQGEIHLALLERYGPPSVLIGEDHQIIHLSSGAGRFLRFAGGIPTTELLRVIHPDLRLEVSAALYAAGADAQDQVRRVPVALDANRPAQTVCVTVRPVREPEAARGFFLVLFEELPAEADGKQSAAQAQAVESPHPTTYTNAVREMEEEIGRLRTRLRSTVDQYEASSEELKATNEELQAVNEEMRSATEELETGREELQSVNEELSTVNNELKDRVEEVSRANSDLNNLLISTGIATIFVDRELRIKRYTPTAETLFNIIPTDVGRPLAHLTHRLDYEGLTDDAEAVLLQLVTLEREVRSADGRHFLARLSPYRTQEDRISGVVVTFVDISERIRAEATLRHAAEFDAFRVALTDALRPLDNPTEVQAEAARVLGRHLRASRVHYGEIVDDGRHIDISWNYTQGVASMAGRHLLSDLGPRVVETLQAGHTIVEPNVEESSSSASGVERETNSLYAIRAQVVIPLVKDSRLIAVISVHQQHPRAWTAEEVALIGETAARTWAAVEQTKAEDALRRARDEMEARVVERTETLTEALTSLETALAQQRQGEEERQRLLRQIVQAQEAERGRISQGLHDQMGQHLTGLLLGLKTLEAALPPDSPSTELATRLQQTAAEMSAEVHHLAWDLHPPALDDLGLEATLQNYVQEWGERYGTTVDFHSRNLTDFRLPPDMETAFYRIVQEALTNVARHAGADRVGVLLERHDDHGLLIVEDNGSGFDVERVLSQPQRLGLGGMRERATLIGGTLSIESSPNGGTTLFVRVPLTDGGETPADA